MSVRPAAVLFDCDGVLIDSEVTSSHVLAAMLTEGGVPTDGDELRSRMKGASLDWIREESMRTLGGSVADPDAWMAEFIARRLVIYRQGVPQIPGAAEAVAAVRSAGIPIAVVSQGARSKMAVTLPASGMDAILGDVPVFSGDDVVRGKPHPDLYLLAAERLGVEPATCVVVEDSVPGVTGALAAGMRVLGFAADADPARFEAVGAEVVHDLHQVPALLGLV
ncbi:MAG: HAD family phosphatase [Solirubrobacteraceae bacterium]|nr:HAD family phosphatase [Solirubrobacteraceae bacterium]